MTIQLKQEQEKFIEAQVASGKYKSPEEVIDKMFLIFKKVQGDDEQWLQERKLKIDEGIESLEKREEVDGELVLEKLQDKIREIDRNDFLHKANQAYLALRNNPTAWQEELEERELWEKTIADGVIDN